MSNERLLSIAKDFSKYPAGRFDSDGPYPGEKCRRKLLLPNLRSKDIVVVDLDGTLGFGSSFLEEAFGGLVREEGMSAAELHQKLRLVGSDSARIAEIWDYIDSAQSKK